VAWLHRAGLPPTENGDAGGPEKENPASTERSAPGLASLFEGLREDGSHSILDLGSASKPSFELYSRFARQIRFAGVLSDPPTGVSSPSLLEALGPPTLTPYDLVLAWNILDLVNKKGRRAIVERLVKLTRPDARIYVLVDGSGSPKIQPFHFELVALDRVRQEPSGPSAPGYPQLLPAEVERILSPFRVRHAFTLRQGWREYVAARRGSKGTYFAPDLFPGRE